MIIFSLVKMTTVVLVNKHLLFVVLKCPLGGTFTDNNRKNETHDERQTRSSIIPITYDGHDTFIFNIISFSLRQYPLLFCYFFHTYMYVFSNVIKRIYTCLAVYAALAECHMFADVWL